MLRFLLLLVLLLSVPAFPPPARAQIPIEDATVIGGAQANPEFLPVRLAAADDDAFRRRISAPPQLEEEPKVVRPSYTVYSSYWKEVLEDIDGGEPDRVQSGVYYPARGHVQLPRDGEDDVWVVLDLRQRAILDRYIRLVERRFFQDAPVNQQTPRVREPGVFDVIKAAARGETVGVSVGGHELTLEQTLKFWQESVALTLRRDLVQGQPRPPQMSAESSTWVLFTLPEGRTVQMLYSVGSGVLVDTTGEDLYPVPPRWLEPVLGSKAVLGSPDYDLAPAAIEQDAGAGSPLWWVLMLGAGMGCLGAAVWLSRRWLSLTSTTVRRPKA